MAYQHGPQVQVVPTQLDTVAPRTVEFLANSSESEVYLKSYWGKVDMALTHDRDNPLALFEAVRAHNETALAAPTTKFADYFFKVALPRLVATTLERRYEPPEWREKAWEFVRDMLLQILRLVAAKHAATDELLGALEPILTKNMEFYQTHGRGDSGPQARESFVVPDEVREAPPQPTELAAVRQWAQIAASDYLTSVYYLVIIDTFGANGGFNLILERVNSKTDKLPSRTLIAFMQILDLMSSALSPSFLYAYVKALSGGAIAYVNAFTEKELREESLDNVTRSLNVLSVLANKTGLTEIAKELEEFKLSMALKYVQLPYLEASLKGIEQICNLISNATGDYSYSTQANSRKRNAGMDYFGYPEYSTAYRSRYPAATRSSGTSTQTSNNMAIIVHPDADKGKDEEKEKTEAAPKKMTIVTTPFLLEWIAKHDIIAKIFKLEHPEALRQCTQIVRFVAKEQGLSPPLLDTIWNASHLHESLQVVVFQLIADLLDVIPTAQIEYLYTRIEQFPATSYNNQVLNFVSDFTKKAIRVMEDRKETGRPFGLELFWALLSKSEENRTSDSIVNETCEHFQQLLKTYPVHRNHFMEKFIANLREGRIVTISLRLLTNVMRSTIMQAPKAEIGPAINALEQNHKLIDSILSDIPRCAGVADPAAAVQSRLDFLEFILTESPLVMMADQADKLWDSILVTKQQDLAFTWMEKLQYSHLDVDPYGPETTKYQAFAPNVIEDLFARRMINLEVAQFTLAGVRMYVRSFVAVNARRKSLRRLGGDECKVRDVDLVGIDRLYDVALDAENGRVADFALSYVGRIFNSVHRKAHSALLVVLSNRVAQAMDHVTKTADALAKSPTAAAKLLRCVTLLQKLVEQGAKVGSETQGVRPGGILAERHFDYLFDLLSVVEIRDSLWTLLKTIPVPQQLLASIQKLPLDGTDLAFAKTIRAAQDQPKYIFLLLYVLQILVDEVQSPEWRRLFIDRNGVNFLVNIFTTQDLLKGAAGEYGKKASAHLVEVINALFTSGDLSPERLSTSLDGAFVHRLQAQIQQLAALVNTPVDPTTVKEEEKKVDEQPAKSGAEKKGTLIANCHYGSTTHNITFDISGDHYMVALYCVDYNTTNRVQHLVAFVGDDKSIADTPRPADHPRAVTLSGQKFHNGQWVVFEVKQAGKFQILIEQSKGPNWVVSACLIDAPPAVSASPPNNLPDDPRFPNVVVIDSDTQGRWRGKYGAWGGVLLGIKDYVAPPRPDRPANAALLRSWDSHDADKYEWIRALTTDVRAMQQVPHDDEVDAGEDDDNDEAPLVTPTAAAAAAAAASQRQAAKNNQTSRALLDMLVAIVTGKENLLKAMCSYSGFDQWLYTCAVASDDAEIRGGLLDAATRLSGESQEVKALFLTKLLHFLDTIASEKATLSHDYTQYFALIERLLSTATAGMYDTKKLLNQLVQNIRARDIVEDEEELNKVDTCLVGMLTLLARVLKQNPDLRDGQSGILDDLFGPCLFAAPKSRAEPAFPKCKTGPSRSAAFSALRVLAESDPSAKVYLAGKLTNFFETMALPTERDWNIDVVNRTTSTTEAKEARGRYVGLKNQGCTCYLNSTLQQLFIIPSLRRDILSVPIAEEPAPEKAPEPVPAEDPAAGTSEKEAAAPANSNKGNIMFQLQTLFAYMQETKNSYVDPVDFCKTVRLAGGPINMLQQEDANEFFNALADQLEPHTKGTPQAAMFRDTFGGTFLHQIISKDCQHSSERPENFLTVSIKVQSKRNVQESLEFFVEGDMLDGNNKYKCEDCQAAGQPSLVAAKKRCCIAHLPNSLALHLIRFEFDYQTFTNVKVNDLFEYPMDLDMYPYTKEGLAEAEGRPVEAHEKRPREYYNYELVGVLVHSGTANAGHYYSYIRERHPVTGQPMPTWFEFNDKSVTPFDQADLAAQTFGGKYSDMSNHQKYYSAYMLFYDRKAKFKVGVYSQEALPPIEMSKGKTQEEVEPSILNKVWSDGIKAAQQRHLMTKHTLDFMWDALTAGPMPPAVKDYHDLTEAENESAGVRTIKMTTRFLMDILCHVFDSRESDMRVTEKFQTLTTMYERNVPACKWLLDTMVTPGNLWLRKVLLFCPDADVRTAGASLMATCVSNVAPFERALYDQVPPGEHPADYLGSSSSVVAFINQVIALLHMAAAKPALKIQQLLQSLLAFAKLGPAERTVLMKKNAVSDLILLYDAHRYPVQMSTVGVGKFTDLVNLLAVLAKGCDNPNHLKAAGQPGVPEPTGIELPSPAMMKLFSRSFLTAILRQVGLEQAAYLEPLLDIFVHWCYGNEELSATVIDIAMVGADANTVVGSRQVYFRILDTLLRLNDAEHPKRLVTIMNFIMDRTLSNIRLPHFRDAYLSFIFNTAEAYDDVREFFTKNDRFILLLKTHATLAQWVEKNELQRFVTLFPALHAQLPLGAETPGEAGVGQPEQNVNEPVVNTVYPTDNLGGNTHSDDEGDGSVDVEVDGVVDDNLD